MTWVKPINMPPREIHKTDQGIALKALGLLGKPLESYAGEYSDSFEYQSFPRPRGDPKQYFDSFKQQQMQACPSGDVTLIRVSDAELLFEARSDGCERFGEQSEIDRFLFGKRTVFHMVYMAKGREGAPNDLRAT
jgi:hypothetical protein